VRDGERDAYGRGRRVDMRFADFVRRAAGGDTSLYLSSQPQRVAADGHPEVLQPPLAALRGDLPLVPALAGHLVPQQLNLWMGASAAGARAAAPFSRAAAVLARLAAPP
jgi:hypothetical protein